MIDSKYEDHRPCLIRYSRNLRNPSKDPELCPKSGIKLSCDLPLFLFIPVEMHAKVMELNTFAQMIDAEMLSQKVRTQTAAGRFS